MEVYSTENTLLSFLRILNFAGLYVKRRHRLKCNK